ncbi:1627_t:CDS:2 [Funneliformis geosporum]|nr:1627_t:CDS:2 [Funneliformis geosporum]
MEFAYITEYLETDDCTRWNLLGVLQYYMGGVQATFRAEDKNLLKSAQSKARQLSQVLDICEPAIKMISRSFGPERSCPVFGKIIRNAPLKF